MTSGMFVTLIASGVQDSKKIKHVRSIHTILPTLTGRNQCFYELNNVLQTCDEIHEWWLDFTDLPYTLKLFFDGKLNQLMNCGDLKLTYLDQNAIVFDKLQFDYGRLGLPCLNLKNLPRMEGKLFYHLGPIEKHALSQYLSALIMLNKDVLNIISEFGIELLFAPKLQLHVGLCGH